MSHREMPGLACDLCEAKFASRSLFDAHMRDVHGTVSMKPQLVIRQADKLLKELKEIGKGLDAAKASFGMTEAELTNFETAVYPKKNEVRINTSPTWEGDQVQVYIAEDDSGQGRWKGNDKWVADVPPRLLGRLLHYRFLLDRSNWRNSFIVPKTMIEAFRRRRHRW